MGKKRSALVVAAILFAILSLGCACLSSSEADTRPEVQPTDTKRATARPSSTPSATETPSPTPRPITWDELVQFIADDHTNWNAYDAANYNCAHYAIDLVEAAHARDLKAWVVAVEFVGEEIGHAFVGFETVDYGIVFIEPQGDNPYWVMEVGKPLCDAWGMYECMGTVKSVEYYQCTDVTHCVTYTP